MNIVRTHENSFISLGYMSIVMLLLLLVSLGIVALNESLAPLCLLLLMIAFGSVLIVIFSNKSEIFLKTKLFVFFFSLYLSYTLINHYLLLSFSPNKLPFNFFDEKTFYHYSNLGLPYISGEKSFFKLFSTWDLPFREMPVHVFLSSLVAYFSILIDGSNTIIVQKFLSPLLGGLFMVVLYSTLKYQFTDRTFALNATLAYGLLSVVFMYSTPLLRDIDVALAYMIFIFLFLQKNSLINLLLLLLVAYTTTYLRVESGFVLFGLTLLYNYLYVRKVQSRLKKFIFYILIMIMITFVMLLLSHKIIGMIITLNESNTARVITRSSADSIASNFRKLPFPLSEVAKVLFGQMLPFPFFKTIDRPIEAISGIFWPFIFIMMLYAVMKKNIRVLLDTKVKYLLIAAISILFLMSSEPMARRMMSVYPVIYITALYVFYFNNQENNKRILFYYLFSIIILNVIYYILKIK